MPDPITLNKPYPIDLGEVLDRIGGDTSFLKDLLKIYFLEYDEKKRILEGAIARQDYIQVGELGHSLKGSSANLGLPRLQKVAFSLEMAGRDKKMDLAKEAARALELEVQNLKVFLEKNPLD